MVDWLITLLQDPTVSALLTTAVVGGGKAIYQKLLCAEKNTPEWQLFNSLDRAFFQAETDLAKKHDTEAIQETFFSKLFDFSSSFSIDTLKQVFQDALGRPATDEELKIWVANVVKQIALPEHEVLFRYLQTLHILPNELTQQPPKPTPILTPGAKIWDDQNILARDDFIDGLCADFSQHPRRIQLIGMGGIGKTEILNKLYAKLAKKPVECGFDFIGLVHFNGTIESDLGQQIEPPKGYLGMQGAEAALRYLRDVCTEHRVLLLVDDIRAQQTLPKHDDKSLEFLKTLNASVLLASRVPFPQFDKHKVDVLPTEECIKIFERQFGRTVTDEEERSLLTKIIEEKAGRNTLIVNRLGSMAEAPGWSIKELFDHLEKQHFHISADAVDDEHLQKKINKLYTLDADFTPADLNILEAFSIFPPIPLALELCKEWLSADAGVEPDECARILSRLTQRTWLVRHESEGGASATMYSMHQVVRAAVKGQETIDGSTHIGLINACIVALYRNTDNFSFAVAAQIFSFAEAISNDVGDENAPSAYLLFAIGSYFNEIGDYTHALTWRQCAVLLSTKVFGKEHVNTAIAINNVASIYYKLADYPNALTWYLDALGIFIKLLEPDNPCIATINNNIAGVFDSQGDYAKALEWYFKALEIREKVQGKEHPATAATYNNIAMTFHKQGNNPKALEWYLKALAILEKVLGVENPYTAATYNNIGEVFEEQGDYFKALELFLKALAIQEKISGKEHPDTAAIYNNIGVIYKNQGDFQNALEWYFKALSIREKVLGNEHPSTAIIYNNIAFINYYQGDYQASLELFQKALPILETKLGHEHPSTKIVLDGIEFVTAKLAKRNPT